MFNLRKEDYSVYLYIKDTVLKPFMEFQEKDPVSLLPELSQGTTLVYQIDTELMPSPFDVGRGLVHFDEDFDSCLVNCTTCSGSSEQIERVIVYDAALNVIPGTSYMIDYVDGRIITASGLIPAYVDYYWYYVSVVDEWPAVQAAGPPVIVLDLYGTDKGGYQLGGGKLVARKGNIHIFASSSAERKDIQEVLFEGMFNKNCPLYALDKGAVLDFDGTFHGRRNTPNKESTLFSRETVANISNLYFEDVSARHVGLPILMTSAIEESRLSNLNAHRAKISFDLVSYTSY